MWKFAIYLKLVTATRFLCINYFPKIQFTKKFLYIRFIGINMQIYAAIHSKYSPFLPRLLHIIIRSWLNQEKRSIFSGHQDCENRKTIEHAPRYLKKKMYALLMEHPHIFIPIIINFLTKMFSVRNIHNQYFTDLSFMYT